MGHLTASLAALHELVDVVSIDTGTETVRTLSASAWGTWITPAA